MSVPLHGPVISPILVGRDPCLDALDRVIEQVCAGRGQTALISGEAGIGKSRLIAETRARFVARVAIGGLGSGQVLQGACFEADRAVPYAPFRDLLRALVASSPPKVVATVVDTAGSDLAKLVPELAGSLASVAPLPPIDPADEKRRLVESLTRLMLGLTQTGPRLVVVEDLHWSDDVSLDVLLHLARRIGDRPLLLLASYRADEVQPVLRHVLAELDRGRLASEFVLRPLTAAGVDEMLDAIFAGRGPVPVHVRETVFALTEGNPFFIEEVLRTLFMAGDALPTGGVWTRANPSAVRVPRSVQDAVQRRVERLSPTARQVLTMAAVMGRRFDFAVLREMTGLDEREVVRCIKELITAQLVIQEPDGQFAFRHALTRQAIDADLLAIERKALHRAAAEAMERLPIDAADMRAGDLASHFFEAGVWDKAFDHARRAGEQAVALLAPREAVAHFTRALDAASKLPGTPLATVYRARGLAYDRLGHFAEARADLEQSLALARATGDGPAEWQALLDLGLLWAARDYERAGDYNRRALDLARTMNRPALLGRGLNRLGNYSVNVAQPSEGRRYHEEALGIFQGLADRRGIAESLDLLALAQWCCGDQRGSIASYDRVALLWRDLGDRPGLVTSLAMLAGRAGNYRFDPLAADHGDVVRAIDAGEEALALAREMQWRSGEAFVCTQLGQCLGAWGAYDRALTFAHDAAKIAREIEHRQWLTVAHEVLGRLYLDLLAPSIARRHLEQGLRLARETNSLIWQHATSATLISTHVHQGSLAEAEEVLANVPGTVEFPHTYGWLLACAEVELALARADPERALRLIDRIDRSRASAEERGERPVGPPHLGRLRGEVLAMCGRTEEAETVLSADLAAARTRDCLPARWRLHLALGRLSQTTGRLVEAEREFAATREVVEQLADFIPDDPTPDGKIDSLRDHFRLTATTFVPRPGSSSRLSGERTAPSGLTSREVEVVRLLAAGRSNREIAAELVVSVRTVEHHIANIYGKIGARRRADAVTFAVRHGLIAVDEPDG